MNTGHVKQVAAFEKLLGYCNAQGAMYNPSKASIQSAALNTLLTSAQQSLQAVVDARTNVESARNMRNQSMEKMSKKMTRIVNTLSSSGASSATIADAYGYVRKFSSKAKVKPPDGAPAAATLAAPPAATPASRRISRGDIDSSIGNFKALITLVGKEPTYQPNEPDLKVSALQSHADEVQNLNAAFVSAQVALSNTMSQRNQLLYADNGIYAAAKTVKRYVKGANGFQSVAYNQIRGLRFENRKLA